MPLSLEMKVLGAIEATRQSVLGHNQTSPPSDSRVLIRAREAGIDRRDTLERTSGCLSLPVALPLQRSADLS